MDFTDYVYLIKQLFKPLMFKPFSATMLLFRCKISNYVRLLCLYLVVIFTKITDFSNKNILDSAFQLVTL